MCLEDFVPTEILASSSDLRVLFLGQPLSILWLDRARAHPHHWHHNLRAVSMTVASALGSVGRSNMTLVALSSA